MDFLDILLRALCYAVCGFGIGVTVGRARQDSEYADDAARYRWLRAGGPGTGLYVADSGNDWREVKGRALDAAVDAGLELNRAEKSERPTTQNQESVR